MRNIPNILSIFRLCSVPILLWLTWAGHKNIFLGLFIFAIFTDWLDGFIARKFNQTTKLGAQLDSWADAAIYFTLAFSAYFLWPEIFIAEILYFILMIASIVVPVFLGLIKFHTLTSYHTWIVKTAAAAALISTIILFLGYPSWPFHAAAILSITAAIEQITITLITDQPESDVRTIWHVCQSNPKKSLSNENMESTKNK